MATYTTNLDIVKVSGIGVQVENESVGTGNASNKSFDLDNGNVVAGSYTLKYSASGNNSNDFTELTETTDYVLDLEGGTILLTTAGLSALSTNNLYADYYYSPEVSDDELDDINTRSSAEIDYITGNYWGTPKDNFQLFDWDYYDYPGSERPYVNSDTFEPAILQLPYKGINFIFGVYELGTGMSIINAQTYDSVAVTYADRTSAANSTTDASFYPFADTPASGDFLYIAGQYQFHSLTVLLSTNGVLSSANSNTIQYYDGSSWQNITATESTSGILNFTTSGKVSWSKIAGWEKTTINSSGSYYFVRFRNLNTFSTVPKVNIIVPGQDYVIKKEINLYDVTWTDWGEITVPENSFSNGKKNVRIDFNHGYSTIPDQAKQLTSVIGGIMALVKISGGSYDSPSTYTIGRKSISIGQLYVNIAQSLKELRARYESLLNQIGKKMDVI